MKIRSLLSSFDGGVAAFASACASDDLGWDFSQYLGDGALMDGAI
jgi:hypothetical protein